MARGEAVPLQFLVAPPTANVAKAVGSYVIEPSLHHGASGKHESPQCPRANVSIKVLHLIRFMPLLALLCVHSIYSLHKRPVILLN